MKEDDYLQLSGIQHYVFCPRQWALIYIEQQWNENERTADGRIMHERVHDETQTEKRGDVLIVRAMPVSSSVYGISGECDVVEFHRAETGVSLHGREGLWLPYPIEYKRGLPKDDLSDEMQLCAQALCLEEMLACRIGEGSLFYGESRRRKPVLFTDELRCCVSETLKKMHDTYARGYTPTVRMRKGCNACSLKGVCLPELGRAKSVAEYLNAHIKEADSI